MVASLATKQKAGNVLDLIGLREIRDSVICLSQTVFTKKSKQERDYRAVLAVQPVNFSLMAESEQEVILEGFRVFLQRLQVQQSISIHVQIRPYDLQPYLDKLDEAQKSTSAVIRDAAREHEEFVLNLASQRAILQRHFYIRIAARPAKVKGKKKLKPLEIFDLAKTQLDLISQGLLEDLKRANLSGHRLDDEELAQYYLSCVHSHFSEDYPVTSVNLDAVNRPLSAVRLNTLHATSSDMTALAVAIDTDEQKDEPLTTERKHLSKQRTNKKKTARFHCK